jgi:putative transposase
MYSISRFQQVMKALPRAWFQQAVQRHQGDRHAKGFTCWDQLVTMVYAQFSGCTSLRELEAGFNQHANQHYHLGTRAVRRSTLSNANARRSPQIFEETLRVLIAQCGRTLRGESKQMLYLLDSTSIALPSRGQQAFGGHASAHGNHGVKLHVLYEANSAAVAHQSITPANVNDIEEAKRLVIEPGAIYVFDKGYCNYNWWHSIERQQARWVSRFRRDARLTFQAERPLEGEAILRDSVVTFTLKRPRGGHVNEHTGQMRRIEVARPGEAPLVLATNDLDSPASRIAELYKKRWDIELFFKWIKQHLSIGRFMGTSANAIRIQLLTALIAYLLVLLLKKSTQSKTTLWMMLAEIRSGLFHRPQTEESYWRKQRAQQAFIHAAQPSLFI